MTTAIIAVILTLAISVPVTFFATSNYRKKQQEETIGNAQEKARAIIDEALTTAENQKREALLEVKEESIRSRNELEKEIRDRRNEVQRNERRVQQKEESLDRKMENLERKEQSLQAKEESLNKQRDEVTKLGEQRQQELERISGLTSEQAKEYLLKIVEDDVRHDSAVMIKEIETEAREEADKRAKGYLISAIQRCAADHVSEATISVVQLPSDEMKGRIIGREGRNIRTLETMTGVDLIIDDTPEAVVISGFDPIRREVARIALEKLIVDGRIHPARIEEMVGKAQREVEARIKEEGEAATLEVGVHGIHPELVRLLGKLRFRTSYGQNALKHSIEVAELTGLMAGECGCDISGDLYILLYCRDFEKYSYEMFEFMLQHGANPYDRGGSDECAMDCLREVSPEWAEKLAELAEKYGSPIYVMDEQKIRENCRKYIVAMKKYFGENAKPFYASKACSFKKIYNIVKNLTKKCIILKIHVI